MDTFHRKKWRKQMDNKHRSLGVITEQQTNNKVIDKNES